ncbi:MAG TPA: HPr family phosphocarrier protein [Streptosporangiaceae bacterium]|jgi:phosphocarrier protein
MAQRTVTVAAEVGLHARPAALFVQAAAKASGDVTVAKSGGDPVNAKSILAVLGLDVRHGEEIVLTAADDTVLDALADLARSAE